MTPLRVRNNNQIAVRKQLIENILVQRKKHLQVNHSILCDQNTLAQNRMHSVSNSFHRLFPLVKGHERTKDIVRETEHK